MASGDQPLATGRRDAGVRLTLLGEVRATVDGSAVNLGGPRQRGVLVVLALARGALVTTDALVDALWADAAPADPLSSLQSFVSRLRARLQPGADARARGELIASTPQGYALRLGPDDVDAWAFERLVRDGSAVVESDPRAAETSLRQALALWQGPPFSEYAAEPWAQAEAARLAGLHAVARERLLAAQLATSDPGVLVTDLQSLVDEEPLREERWRLLALALYRSHRQADALAALRRARQLLADELGVDPGPALRALEEQVLSQSPALHAAAPPAGVPAPVSGERRRTTAAVPAPRATGPETGPLVERQQELALLDACLQAAARGDGCVAFVDGPAGIGKSRLLAEFRRRAAAGGALVLYARASQLEQEFSYGAARQLFEPLLADPARAAELLSGAAAAASHVFDVGAIDTDESAFATLHGLYWLTVNAVAGRPAVLVVDDLHWCDSGSLRFLAYLARRLEGLPVALVTAYRTGETHALAAVIEDLRHDGGTVSVTPGPLTRDAVAAMIRDRLGTDAEDAFIDACVGQTGGNPLLVRQLLRALEAEGVSPTRAHADVARALGSRAVSSMVLRRVGRLGTAATAVGRALAVLGDGAALPLVAELAELPETVAADACSQLVAAEILRPEPPLGFVHALVRDAIYHDVPPGRRELMHDAAAHLLARAGRPDAQVAAQLLQAPRRGDGWVVDVLRRAARDAVRRGSADGAVTFLRRALAEPAAPDSTPHVLLELGLVETFTDGESAGGHLQAAYDSLADDDSRGIAALALTRTLVFVGALGAPVTFAAAARPTLPEDFVDVRAAILALERVAGHMHGVDAHVWGFDEEPPIPSGDGYGARMLQAAVAYDRMCRTAPRADAVEMARAALSDGQLIEHDPGLLWVWAQDVLDLADEDVLPMWDEINRSAHERGSLFSVLACRLWQGFALGRRGELAEAELSLRAAIEQLNTWQRAATTMSYVRAVLARVLVDQGRHAEARVVVGGFDAPITAMDGDRLVVELDAELLLLDGRPADALRRLERVVHRIPHVTNPAWRRDRLLWCEAAHAAGRTADALASARLQLELARRWGAPSVVGGVLLVLGRLRGSDGVGDLREAVSLLAGAPTVLVYADALIALGAALAASEPAEATRLLHAAHAIGERTGAGRIVAAAAGTLVGHALERPSSSGAGGRALTPTERRILQLTHDGATVHEVGQKLFMTPSTVERHLAAARQAERADLPTS
jgi:DNA-binding SARP family transcriptional activator/tetratricopeptide (TPR) repeat protein/DNA-binding CsgD family transcriptional regulator